MRPRTSSRPRATSAPRPRRRKAASPTRSRRSRSRSARATRWSSTPTKACAPARRTESLGGLRPAFSKDGTITAGNASQISDGARRGHRDEQGEGRGARRDAARGADRLRHGRRPRPVAAHAAVARDQARARAQRHDAPPTSTCSSSTRRSPRSGIASMRDLGISDDIVNVNGGAIALGHPIGMSGTRVVHDVDQRAAPARRRRRRRGAVRRRRPRRRRDHPHAVVLAGVAAGAEVGSLGFSAVIPELRPRGIGEILDAAVALYRARFGQLVRYAAIVVVPVQVLLTLVLLSAQPDQLQRDDQRQRDAAVRHEPGRSSAATFVVLVVGVLTHAFVVRGDDARSSPTSTSATPSRPRRRRAPPPAAFFAVIGVGVLVGLVRARRARSSASSASFAAQALFAVAIPVVILERRRVFAAMGRSVELTRSHFWHVLGVVLAREPARARCSTSRSRPRSTSGRRTAAARPRSRSRRASPTPSRRCSPRRSSRPRSSTLYFDLRIRDEAFDVQMAIAPVTRAEPAAVDPDDARARARAHPRRAASSGPRPRRGRSASQLSWLGDRLHGDRRLDRPTCSRTSRHAGCSSLALVVDRGSRSRSS